MAFEHDDQKPYEQQHLYIERDTVDGNYIAGQKPCKFIGFPIIVLKSYLKRIMFEHHNRKTL